MMKKFTLLLIVLLFAGAATAIAQQRVSGTVVDGTTGDPVTGAIIRIEGGSTSSSSATNAQGSFSIAAQKGQKLLFSSLGYLPFTFEIGQDGQKEIAIELQPDVQTIEDVVVVGYGTQRKRDVTGSIVQIKTDNLRTGMVTNAAQMIQGRAAGVQVRSNSGEPGGGMTIRIRGASSISSNNDPLYVIDGYQTTLGNSINPNDIESLEILKDAAATAIYGARGANGVIIITTKKGKVGHFSADYSYSASAKMLHNPWDLMNAQDMIGLNMRVWEENGSSGNPPYTETELAYKGAGTDWIQAATQTGWTQQHQVNIGGGTKKLSMNLSGGYYDDKGILRNTDFNRFSARLNLEYRLSDRVRFGANTYVTRTNRSYQQMGRNSTDNNTMYTIFNMSPLTGLDDKNVFGNTQQKPQLLKSLNDVTFENILNDVYVSAYGEADIVKDRILTARVQYTYGNSNGKNRSYYPQSTNVGKAAGGLADIMNYREDNTQLDALLTYNQVYGGIHNFKLMAGTTLINYRYTDDAMSAQGFASDEYKFNNMGAAAKINSISSYQSERSSLSFFARAEYVLNDKYSFNAIIRADGSSNFGEGNKWGYFPSVSAAWQLGDEPFMEGAKSWLSGLKLRASYGETGNDGIDPYLSLRKYATASAYLGGPDVVKGLYPSNPANPLLKWETTSQFNVGLDLSLANRKVEINLDYYVKTTRDLLNRVAVSNATGGFSTMMQNNGKIENKGWELFIRSSNITRPHFSWSTTLNLAQNFNTVLEYNGGAPSYLTVSPQGWYNNEEYSVLEQGQSMSMLYGYVFKGVLQKGESYAAQPKSVPGDPMFEDTDGDGVITPKDRTMLGKGTPDITIGLGNTFNFYNFDVTLFIDAALGHSMFNLTRLVLEDNGRMRASADRWTQNHPSTEIPRNGYRKDSGLQYGSFVNSRFVEDASYVRIQNFEIGYSIPFRNWKNANKVIKGLRVHMGIQNAFTWTKYTGFTPDVSVNGGNAIAQGLDYNTYPAYRMFNFGAKITF